MITVQCVILFTKISRIGNKVVCIYSGNFRLNYVFIQLQKDRHICLILLLYFLLHQRSFLNFVVKNFQDDFQYFIFELCFCILIFGYVVGHESGFKRWSSPKGGDPERIRIQAQHIVDGYGPHLMPSMPIFQKLTFSKKVLKTNKF